MAEKPQPVRVLYCAVCSLPAEYCEFGPDFEKCKPWLIRNAPDLYPDLSKEADKVADQLQSTGLSSSAGASGDAAGAAAAPSGGTSAPKQEEVKRLPGGKIKKKEKQEVVIEKVTRNKRKCITTVKGLELFESSSPEDFIPVIEKTSSSSLDPNFPLRRTPTVTDSAELIAMESEDLKGKENDKVKSENRVGGGGGGGSDVKFTYRPSVPAHRTLKESPLSSAAIFKQSHAGLFNLCIVVLVAVNGRLIIENLMKYGWLIKTGFWFSSKSLRDWPLFMCCLTLPLFFLAAYLVEKLAYWKYQSEPVVVSLHVIITTTSLLYPVSVILSCDSAFLFGVALMLFACIVWLKLVSYAHTNADMRSIARSMDKEDASSKDNSYDVCLKSLVYFMVAPTLCYQPSYPRTACVRKGWVVRQSVKLIVFTGLMGFIIEQYINPIVQNSQHPLKGDFLYAIERVLKLSVPNLYVWLCMFYCFFHLWLNILAELLRFGDREFYKDWWNAKTVEEYWRMWNMPVHKWMVRHIYFPCLRNNVPKGVALVIAFLVSAAFHELCIAVPCHVFKLWAFIGIMFQVPLVVITNLLQNKFRNSMVGNMIFWVIFCILGQPMCVLLYYHDLMNRKGKIEAR